MIKTIAVLGSGVMGHGIAQNYAVAGYKVHLYDLQDAFLDRALELMEANLSLQVKEELITKEMKDNALQNITTMTSLEEAVQNVDFITEAVPEVLDIKLDLFNKLEALISEEVIIASNTSTFSISQLAQDVKHTNRFVITHFFNPAQHVPLVEIVKHENTSEQVVETTMKLMEKIGKTPVVLEKDIPGFIANRLQAALVREAFHLLEEGIADAKSIDLALTSGPGFRWAFSGPLEIADFGGLDIWKSVVENLAPELSKAEKVPGFINDKVTNKQLGTKTGEGIYKYTSDVVQEKLVERDENLIRLEKIKGQ